MEYPRSLTPKQTLRSENPARICILGGGFGGLYSALYLRRFHWLKSPNCQITLVEQKDHFLFTPLLYELVTGELQRWKIAPSYQKLLANTNIQFCQQKIQGVNLQTRQVKLEGGYQLAYDYLVLAVGGQTWLANVPGVDTYALSFRTLADVECLQEKLRVTAQAAYQQAACAARNINAALTGRRLRRFHYWHLGDMLTLGKGAAVVSSYFLTLEGSLAATIRRLVYIQRLPTLRHRLQVLKHLFVSSVLKALRFCWWQLTQLFSQKSANNYQKRTR